MFTPSPHLIQTITCLMFLSVVHAQTVAAQSSSANHRTTAIRSWPASPLMTAEQEKKILDALTAPNTVLKPGELTLNQIAQQMNEVVPTWLDLNAITDTVHTADHPFTITPQDADASLASVLVRLFGDGDLSFNVRNAMVEITSTESAESQVGQSSRVYDITPLIDRYEETEVDPSDYNSRSGGYQVIECILTTVYPDGWADTAGGPYTISSYRNGDQTYSVIGAPTIVQLSIQSLLDTLNHTNLSGGVRTIRGSFNAAQRALARRQTTE